MGKKSICRRNYFSAVVLSLLLLMGLFFTSFANASSDPEVTGISVDKSVVYPGETVQVSITYNNPTAYDVAATVRCTDGSTNYSEQITLASSATNTKLTVNFPIGYTTFAANYSVAVMSGGNVLYNLAEAFAVNEIIVWASSVTPSEVTPVEVFAGDTVNVSFQYTSPADTVANIAIRNISSDTINLGKTTSSKTAGANLVIPATAAEGNYNLTISFQGSSYTVIENKAVKVKRKPTAELNISSPTRVNPVTVRPGDNLTVKYNYTVSSDTTAYVRLVQGNNTVLVSREENLLKASTSGSTTLTIPTSVAVGKYNLLIVTKSTGETLATEQEAVLVEHRVSADITSPTRSKPVSVSGGDKVTVNFTYTADVKSNVDLKIQKSDSEVLLTSTVALDRATSAKQKTVTVTIPSNSVGGKYDLVLKSPVSGTTLNTEREAVTVDAKVTADITSPTKTKPATVKAGGTLQVKFDYTSNADSSVDIKVLKKDGSALATANASIDRATSKKSKTVSVSIPSSAALGKYDLVVTAKYSGKVLDTETQALIVEDPVAIKITSPTETNPTRFNTTGKVEVRFSYTAETSSDVEFRLLKPDGKTLAKTTQYLSRTSTSMTDKVGISLPAITPAASYDIEVVNKDTGNRLALEQKAVIVTSFPVNIQVKFLIGQSGRWVNGTYHSTDLDARIIQGRTMLPIRHVGEPLGWELKWDDTSKMATVIKGDRQVRVWVNNSNGQVSTNDGRTWQTVRIDTDNASVQPLLISGRVLLPLRFVSEALDTGVVWDATTRTVTVRQD